MKPSPNRNREKCAELGPALARAYRKQLPKTECAQKESNLQPASSGALSNRRESGSVPYSAGVTPTLTPPTKPESAESNRYGSVTEDSRFGGSSHKAVGVGGPEGNRWAVGIGAANAPDDTNAPPPQQPYALSSRPDLLAELEGWALVGRMGL